MKKVVIHSDGACHGNPGPGGWAATLACDSKTREISGGVLATTNNRMELQAAIEGLAALTEACEVDFFTDSSYLKNGVTAWISLWKRNGWRTKGKEPVKNEDLWRQLDALVARHKVTWHWVKGHAGHAGNERCDVLATEEIEKIKKANSSEQLKAGLEKFVQKPATPLATDFFAGLK
jgi:ribonuclease HI